jgi:hypothetical protein
VGRTTSWAASLLLATAALLVVSVGGRALLPALSLTLLPLRIVVAILLAAARFLLWRLAVGRRGAAVLLWSALLGLVGAMFLVSWLGPRLVPGWSAAFVEIDLGLSLAALALQSFGMLRARLVPTWVATIGLTSSALGLFARLAWMRLGIGPSYAAVGLEVVFLVAAGLSLLTHHAVVTVEDVQLSSAL